MYEFKQNPPTESLASSADQRGAGSPSSLGTITPTEHEAARHAADLTPKPRPGHQGQGSRGGLRVLVVDHHDSYTWNLVHLVAGVTGTLPDVVQHDETTADALLSAGYTHIVLSPGPGSPDVRSDFSVGRDVLREADVPVLGVCLGMQGLVSVYGGTVGQVEPAHGEVAVVEHNGRGVFAGLPERFSAVRYHSLAVRTLPDVLEETAWCVGVEGRVVMGVAHRSRPLVGVQFHPESILTEHGEQLLRNFLEVR